MSTNIEKLELTPAECEFCRTAIRERAYRKWRDAGCPKDRSRQFWLEAEDEWVGRNYVPHRFFEDDFDSMDDGLGKSPVTFANCEFCRKAIEKSAYFKRHTSQGGMWNRTAHRWRC